MLSHLPLTTDAQMRLQCIFFGIYVGHTDIDAGFVQVLLVFLFQYYFHNIPHTHTHTFVYHGNR